MSKLSASDKFFDLSDYGRQPAVWIANQLKNTKVTPIHITFVFGIVGLFAVYFILIEQFLVAAILLIFKSILDAADGELARLKKTPSYTGRYLDSIFDIIINLLIFAALYIITKGSPSLTILAFIGLQLQGTLYNYYYVILRNNSAGGDTTSRIFEYKIPKALQGESQKKVNVLFLVYTSFYGAYDRIIYVLDGSASKCKTFPKWFMTCLSIYGLGFQLLIIAVMLNLNLKEFIIPFFILFTGFVLIFIIIRKLFLNH